MLDVPAQSLGTRSVTDERETVISVRDVSVSFGEKKVLESQIGRAHV